jgi:N-acetylmuramoyl-L-alanine amidase
VLYKVCKYIVLFAAVAACLPLSGCVESESSGSLSGQTRPAYCLTIEELATRLGLSVGPSGSPYYELTNAYNTVKLFMYDGGRVYVNGTAVGTVGPVQKVGGKTYVPELLVPKIRGALLTQAPPKTWTPAPETPTRIGSGIVVIDPGHGGYQPGTTSVLGAEEKDVNLKIAHKVVANLRQAGVTVKMTRQSDKFVALEDRAALANRVGADLFVSIHCDWIGDSTHKGFTVYVARSASWGSKKAARAIERRLSDASIPSKGMRKEDFRVLVNTKGPAVLVECGYMSNYDEAALLVSPWYQNKLAKNIADAILDYL